MEYIYLSQIQSLGRQLPTTLIHLRVMLLPAF